MLKPIPRRILTHSALLKVCSGVDVWQKPTWTEIQLDRVCMQPTHATAKDKNNTDVFLRSLLFIDAVGSLPKGIDIQAMQETSETNGNQMQIEFDGLNYTVLTIDKLYDDCGRLHHWEVGLV